jgi:hypothetical protein
MKPMYLGDGQWSEYRPWCEERRRAARNRANTRYANERRKKDQAALTELNETGREILKKMGLRA